MVRVHKRNKRTRSRGSRTLGTGFRKKNKGHGNKGGHGWSGTGKRGSQKQQKALMFAKSLGFKSYLGRRGLTSASTAKVKTYQMNLYDIYENFFNKENTLIRLERYKILGTGEGFKAEILAKAATKVAIEKMEKAGGKVTLVKDEEKKKEVVKKEEPVKKVIKKKIVKK